MNCADSDQRGTKTIEREASLYEKYTKREDFANQNYNLGSRYWCRQGNPLCKSLSAIQRYKDQNTWKKDPLLLEKDFYLLQQIIKDAGELNKIAPYDKVVTTQFAFMQQVPGT